MMERFRHKVFRRLLGQEKITQTPIETLLAWRHRGFSVYRGEKVDAEDEPGREPLARYILPPDVTKQNDLRSPDR